MARRRVKGDRAFRRILRKLPDTIKADIVEMLDDTGDAMLAAMRADAPTRTGALRQGLSKKVLKGSLRLRVGLLSTRAGRSKLFYGRIVQFGRKAQTVQVRRRRTGVARRLSRGRKVTADIGAVYNLRVRAMAPQPFVYSERTRRLRETLAGQLSGFWDRVLAKVARGVNDD